jgi:hypothetical protein
MYIKSSNLNGDLKVASKLINEFLNMDPISKSQLNNGFIQSMIEPFLGKSEQFNKILEEEISAL